MPTLSSIARVLGRRASLATMVGFFPLVLATLACGGDSSTGVVPVESAHSFWKLQVNHRALTLSTVAPYDTAHLSANAFTGDGSALDVGTVHYSTRDTSVIVDSTGFVRAHSPVVGAYVFATATVDGLTLRDSVIINVNTDVAPPTVTTFSIRPSAGKFYGNCSSFLYDQIHIVPVITDGNGNPITNVAVSFSSSNNGLVSTFDNPYDGSGTAGISNTCNTGRTMVYASATVYGKTVVDSVPVIVTPPLYVLINVFSIQPKGSSTPVSTFNPGTITVGAGASVTWWNQTKRPIDIIFDTPSAAVSTDTLVGFFPQVAPSGGGSIAPFVDTTDFYMPDNYRARRFPTPGTYPYHSSNGQAHGVVIVLPLEPTS